MQAEAQEAVVIKKYANRRLYDTGTSAYITLEDLCQRVKDGKDFVVVDAKTGQDITRQVLTQIIFEQETKGFHLLPTNFLRSAIRFYDDNMNGVMQHYLEASMKTFVGNQDKMRGIMGKAIDGASPFAPLEEMTRNNVALFEKAMSMFSPMNYFNAGESVESSEEEAMRAKRNTRR
ncbi:MAG: polyhydroxyalkanoate synthesis repressor PhaR [Alphaproteobacteria bacterium]